MKRGHPTNSGSRLRSDTGQTTIFVVLALGIFLLGAVAFGVDFANFWFHRQAAQGAADAACTAGVMDMLAAANTGLPHGGFTAGTDFDCQTTTSAAPCRYAALNGYDGANSSPGSQVLVSFPGAGSVPGLDPNAIPGAGLVPNPLLRVDVIDHVQTFFSGMLTGNHTQDVHVRATCAVLKATAPIPLILLKPTCANIFLIPGNGTVAIIGGPSRSIQTNSSDPAGVSITGSGSIDLSNGGPNFTGSDMGVFGGPSTAPSGFNGGSTGGWSYPVTPIADPFALVPPPGVPAPAAVPTAVAYGVDGCPDHTGSNKGPVNTTGCVEYHPGLYTTPIVVKQYTAIFVPGLYYFNIPAGSFDKANCGTPGGCIAKPTGQCNYALSVDSSGVVRTSTATGDGSSGVTFYLSGAGGANGYGSVFFGSNAGNSGGRTVDAFNTTGTGTAGVRCPGGPLPDPHLLLPSTVPGDVLLGPCTQDGTYFTSPTNGSQTGPVRGLLFFQDRANGDNYGQPSMQGGGGLLIAGTMYFHNCPNSPDCSPPANYYKAFLQFQGTSGSGTFLLGNITTDELITGGGGTVSMQLDSARVYTILKATLIQ
jgi:hypothetical protein